MKKMLLALVLFFIIVCCFVSVIVHKFITQHGHNISISVRESGHTYHLYASYNRNKTRMLQRYLDKRLHSDIFTNTRLKGNIALEDHTNFYVLSNPGRLVIKLDRDDNSVASYLRIKALGDEIKRKLAEN
jgi:hypothetical protein